MAYAIARIAKLKGGSVAASDRHIERLRETPNADREKQHTNRRLIGDERPLRALVTEMIERHGGRPRSDSVECVELMLGASPEHFTEGRETINSAKVRAFSNSVREFLQEQYGARCVKAVLHMVEKTPHVQAFMVPIDERGRLNCKAFFGTREKLRCFQNAYAEKMRVLGLERGIEGSRATHQEIGRFYGAINREVRLRVEPERIPDPPRVMVTEASRKEYKQQVIKAVAEQIHEPVNTLDKQAKLAREEKGKREAAERRAAKAEAREKEWAEKYLAEQRENIAFHHQTRKLAAELSSERQQKIELSKQVEQSSCQIQELSERVQDIPLIDVMKAFDYRGERHDERSVIYRDAQGSIALTLADDKAAQGNGVVARNAIDLAIHVREVHQQKETTPRDAITWLADTFGKERAVAATVVRSEQQAMTIVCEQERSRELERQQLERQRQPEISREHSRMSR